jgi:hypothetical protein
MKNLFKSLASFQQEVKAIDKDTKGYGYTYASLSTIFEVINPLLKKHGLCYSQPITGTSVKTIIFHIESGEYLEHDAAIPQGVELKGQNPFQVLGSAITYIRRYALSSALGLITDKDTDASGEQVSKSETTPQQPDKPYLNKVTTKNGTIYTSDWSKVTSALMEGKATILDVKKKFKLSKEIETELNTLIS